MAKCKAYTDRFNCGYCEDTALDCDLQDGHPETSHETTMVDDSGQRYDITWRIARRDG